MNQERFFCTNCLHVGELNLSLRCDVCDSDAVISEQRVKQATDSTLSQIVRSFPPPSPKRLYRVDYQGFYTTLFAVDERAALHQACFDVEQTWQIEDPLDEHIAKMCVTTVNRNNSLDMHSSDDSTTSLVPPSSQIQTKE